MSAYEVLKHNIDQTEPQEVHQNSSRLDCEDFIHTALRQPENIDCLYTLNEGEKIFAGYRNMNGQIVCKAFM